MAKYSKHMQKVRTPDKPSKPKIYLDIYKVWDFVSSKSFFGNYLAEQFCHELNSAAPKRGLKA